MPLKIQETVAVSQAVKKRKAAALSVCELPTASEARETIRQQDPAHAAVTRTHVYVKAVLQQLTFMCNQPTLQQSCYV